MLLANFVAVPIFGVLFVRLFQLSGPIAAGILLMAISPGGRGILLAGARAKGGSLALAEELVFLLPALSIITVPITAHFILADAHISTRILIVVLAVFQLVPLLIGMFVNDRSPAIAARLTRPLRILMLIAFAVVIVILAAPLVRSITSVYGSHGMLAISRLSFYSVITGWILGGSQREFRRTLGLGTALRSFAFCAAIATASFSGTER